MSRSFSQPPSDGSEDASIAVVGPTNAGKTTLINAGLVQRHAAAHLETAPVDISPAVALAGASADSESLVPRRFSFMTDIKGSVSDLKEELERLVDPSAPSFRSTELENLLYEAGGRCSSDCSDLVLDS